MKIGIVCPYSFDVPGGVQFHIRDLAEHFIAEGHDVSVLAPADDDTPVPDYVEVAGSSIPVPYNGSVARLTFGPVAAARVRRWLRSGEFDVLHIHEPISPSLGVLALWAAKGPIVATFHSSQERSRAMQVVYPILRGSLEKISARIAVSEDARRTVVDHIGGDAVVIPNGVNVSRFAQAPTDPRWTWTPERPTITFLGRLDEPRKGFSIYCDAMKSILAHTPGARFIVAGKGDLDAAREQTKEFADSIEFLGPVSDDEKASLLRSSFAYIAPQTGGESFGIVLVEAMSAGTAVVSADLGAFRRVLDDGAWGKTFPIGDADALASCVIELIDDLPARDAMVAAASAGVWRFDWSTVASQIMTVYETVTGDSGVVEDVAWDRDGRIAP